MIILFKNVRRGILAVPDIFIQIFNLLYQEELVLLSQLVKIQIFHKLIDHLVIPLFTIWLYYVLALLIIFHDSLEHIHRATHLQIAFPCSHSRSTFTHIIISTNYISNRDWRSYTISCCSLIYSVAFNTILSYSLP